MAGLPFLDPKKMGSVIIAKRKPSGATEPMKEEGESEPGLMSAADALISAVHSKDGAAVAKALEDAFATLDKDDAPEAAEEKE